MQKFSQFTLDNSPTTTDQLVGIKFSGDGKNRRWTIASLLALIPSGSLPTKVQSAAFAVYLSTNASKGNTANTLIPFDTIGFDYATTFSTANNYYVVPADGLYRFSAALFFTSGLKGTVWLQKNGANFKHGQQPTDNTASNQVSQGTVNVMLEVVAGDHISVAYVDDTPANRTIVSSQQHTWFEGQRVC